MKFVKKAALWLAGMLLIVTAVNFAGGFFLKCIIGNTLAASMLGYSKRAPEMLHPVRNEAAGADESNGYARLLVRSALSDMRLRNDPGFFYNLVFCNFTVDQTNIFLDTHGAEPLSSGIFTVVYEDMGGSADYMKHIVGVLDVEALTAQNCAPDIYKALETCPDAGIRLNSYAMEGYVVRPASITLLDAAGGELLTVQCSCEGELLQANNLYVYNHDPGVDPESGALRSQMDIAYLGERHCDRAAQSLADRTDFTRGDYEETKTRFGFARITTEITEVQGEGAMVSVLDVDYRGGVILYTVLLGSVLTAVMVIVSRKR